MEYFFYWILQDTVSDQNKVKQGCQTLPAIFSLCEADGVPTLARFYDNYNMAIRKPPAFDFAAKSTFLPGKVAILFSILIAK